MRRQGPRHAGPRHLSWWRGPMPPTILLTAGIAMVGWGLARLGSV